MGFRGKALVGDLGDFVPQKLKHICLFWAQENCVWQCKSALPSYKPARIVGCGRRYCIQQLKCLTATACGVTSNLSSYSSALLK